MEALLISDRSLIHAIEGNRQKYFAGVSKTEDAVTYDAAAPALHKMERAAIAAASHITYQPSELLMLIHDHLSASGLEATAAMLKTEAAAQADAPLASTTGSQNNLGGIKN